MPVTATLDGAGIEPPEFVVARLMMINDCRCYPFRVNNNLVQSPIAYPTNSCHMFASLIGMISAVLPAIMALSRFAHSSSARRASSW
jgi:hypothetical protein